MDSDKAYQRDLAYIHDRGFGGFARGAAPGVLQLLRDAGIDQGLIIDVGCGSGIWAEILVQAGYGVVAVDSSAAMIELARARTSQVTFYAGFVRNFAFPACRAVTALGEVFNYMFDSEDALGSLHEVCERIFAALQPGGLLVFDIATPGRSRGLSQAFREGDDWTCLVEYHHDLVRQQLTRRIVTFRKIDGLYRRHEETHRQQLFEEAQVVQLLRGLGFQARTARGYGNFQLPDSMLSVIASKPGAARRVLGGGR